MGSFLSLPIMIIVAVVQATVMPRIRILGGDPDLVLLFVLAWSLNVSLDEGVVWAFAGGILVDLLSYNPTGTTSLGLLILVFAISGLGQQVYRIGPIILLGIVLVGTVLQEIVAMLVLAFTGYPVDWLTGLAYVTAPTVFYNLALILPVYWFVRRIQKRIVVQT